MIEFKPLYCERRQEWYCCKIMYNIHVPTQTLQVVIIELGGYKTQKSAQMECNDFIEAMP